jgi:two-component system, sensor histidine kinase and response regulator
MKALCEVLELEGYATTGVTAPSQALAALRAGPFDLLLTDLMMPEMDGVELLREAQQLDADISGVVMTGHGTIDTAVKAMQAGAYDYILKPFRLNQLLPVIARALEARRLRRLNRELELGLRQRTQELEIANRDLEAFSYSVSHDLRVPLRQIQGYCDIFLAEHAGSLALEGQRLLQHVWSGATRMSQMIEDLLAFARYSREPLTVRRVSMQALVSEIVTELRAAEPARHVELTIADLPDCAGDATLLRQVLVNLLSNALKFTSARDPARIEVGHSPREGQVVYAVKDNGAGFDAKYAAKLFGVFQRLHSQEEFKGTGVGLSIVRRIIERHGGTVWAEGEPEHGATFFFSVPVAS